MMVEELSPTSRPPRTPLGPHGPIPPRPPAGPHNPHGPRSRLSLVLPSSVTQCKRSEKMNQEFSHASHPPRTPLGPHGPIPRGPPAGPYNPHGRRSRLSLCLPSSVTQLFHRPRFMRLLGNSTPPRRLQRRNAISIHPLTTVIPRIIPNNDGDDRNAISYSSSPTGHRAPPLASEYNGDRRNTASYSSLPSGIRVPLTTPDGNADVSIASSRSPRLTGVPFPLMTSEYDADGTTSYHQEVSTPHRDRLGSSDDESVPVKEVTSYLPEVRTADLGDASELKSLEDFIVESGNDGEYSSGEASYEADEIAEARAADSNAIVAPTGSINSGKGLKAEDCGVEARERKVEGLREESRRRYGEGG